MDLDEARIESSTPSPPPPPPPPPPPLPARVLKKQDWSIKDLLYGQEENYLCGMNAGNPELV